MSIASRDSPKQTTLERTYDASAEQVFELWTPRRASSRGGAPMASLARLIAARG